ncbi:hypothetical protein HJB84_28575 [Rhizobium sp. NZLR1b]|uniref:hypothetical protein n=1 Tax=Rhizobium sp. NZLR1b TaxID=2731099 RepID=UPI001C82E282|nr:hypothetical protein [Rhizobium sp. NZLR1b]MBX5173749.1 hypothetical protein [Rhizobium sp. NZLR1b]
MITGSLSDAHDASRPLRFSSKAFPCGRQRGNATVARVRRSKRQRIKKVHTTPAACNLNGQHAHCAPPHRSYQSFDRQDNSELAGEATLRKRRWPSLSICSKRHHGAAAYEAKPCNNQDIFRDPRLFTTFPSQFRVSAAVIRGSKVSVLRAPRAAAHFLMD